jgi:hypothetical protein
LGGQTLRCKANELHQLAAGKLIQHDFPFHEGERQSATRTTVRQ